MHKLILNILSWKHTHGLLVEHPLWNQGLMCKERVGTRANVLKHHSSLVLCTCLHMYVVVGSCKRYSWTVYIQSSENTELYYLESNPKVFAVVLLFHFFCKGVWSHGALLILTTFACEPPDLLFFYELFY